MRPYSVKALELLYRYEAKIIDRKSIKHWADQIILEYDYDDEVAQLSMAAPELSEMNFRELIENLTNDTETITAMRAAIGAMYVHLLEHPEDAHSCARVLENFWICEGYDIPEDMEFIVAVDDEFELSTRGIWGDKDSATESLISNLKPFHRLA